MSISTVKNKVIVNLTDADRKLFGGIDEPDLQLRDRSTITLMQTNSPQLIPGEKRSAPAGTTAGDFVARRLDGTQTVFKGKTGLMAQLIGCRLAHPEYEPSRGTQRGRFVHDHGERRPPDTRFLYADRDGVEKSGYYKENGNRVVPTITALLLVEGFGYALDFENTAYAVGQDLSSRAARLRVKIGDDVIGGPVVGKFLITSELEKKGDRRWFKSVIGPVYKLGEEKGPTLEEVRFAKGLRDSFKAGGEWAPRSSRWHRRHRIRRSSLSGQIGIRRRLATTARSLASIRMTKFLSKERKKHHDRRQLSYPCGATRDRG
jgi:hypothetical protein